MGASAAAALAEQLLQQASPNQMLLRYSGGGILPLTGKARVAYYSLCHHALHETDPRQSWLFLF